MDRPLFEIYYRVIHFASATVAATSLRRSLHPDDCRDVRRIHPVNLSNAAVCDCDTPSAGRAMPSSVRAKLHYTESRTPATDMLYNTTDATSSQQFYNKLYNKFTTNLLVVNLLYIKL